MTSCAGSESTADSQRWRKQDSSDGTEVSFFGGGGGLRGQLFHWYLPCCHVKGGGPSVALYIPTWEACKWRGSAVVIYSPQLLTLDSELIIAKGKSDRTWRVPEPVTLISVRCLQQEVREEELASVCFRSGFVHLCLCVCLFGGWLNHDSRWNMLGSLVDLNAARICATITVHFGGCRLWATTTNKSIVSCPYKFKYTSVFGSCSTHSTISYYISLL